MVRNAGKDVTLMLISAKYCFKLHVTKWPSKHHDDYNFVDYCISGKFGELIDQPIG